MNLLEHYLVKVVSQKDVTEEFESYMKKSDPDFVAKGRYFEIELISDCYGRLGKSKHIWSEAEYFSVLERGYYMG